jgi:transglutaminase-like putative cysteine protease
VRTAVTRRRPSDLDGYDGRYGVRRTALALLASALGVLPLCELFTDRGWLIDVWLTMIVVVAPAALRRRVWEPSAGQIWLGVVLMVPWLTLNFFREHAVLGVLPLGGAWHDVGRLMSDLHTTISGDVAPVHTTVAVRLAVCALLGLVAALVDLLAVVGRHGALAGIPLLVVFTVSGAVPRHPVNWLWFAFSAAGFLILLALDSSDDLQRWGHLVPRPHREARRRAAGTFSGQRIAAAAIVLAIAVPLIVPSNSRNFVANLFHPSSGGGQEGFGQDLNSGAGSGGIDPFAALRGQLNRNKNLDLLTVRIRSDTGVGTENGVQPFYLRTNVLSSFESDGWRPGLSGQSQRVADTQFASSPGTAFQPSTVRYSADITVTGLRSNPPVFASPTSVTGVDSSTSWDLQNLLLVDSTISAGQTIHEEVAQPQPSIAQLRAATGTDPAMSQWLKLPPIKPYVRALTQRLTAGATTPYAKARAISAFFADPNSGFTYSLETAAGDSGDDLTDFLQHRAGYCQQFAASMGVMLRLSGVPSRVVLGYAHPVPDRNGSFVVTTYDAHAWVEAYFAGIGWVPFDPTPIAGISGGSANDLAWAPHGKKKDTPAVVTPGSPTSTPSPRTTHPTQEPVATVHPDAGLPVVPLVLLAVVAVLLALLLTPTWVRLQRRRRRLRQGRLGDTEALWAELSDTAIDLGYVWSPARSPRQVATWLGSSGDASTGSLRALTGAVERARYSPVAGPGPDLVDELAAVRAGLRARRSPRERMRATFWPASLGWSTARWFGRWLPGRANLRRH